MTSGNTRLADERVQQVWSDSKAHGELAGLDVANNVARNPGHLARPSCREKGLEATGSHHVGEVLDGLAQGAFMGPRSELSSERCFLLLD
jgi:hypothetical protein